MREPANSGSTILIRNGWNPAVESMAMNLFKMPCLPRKSVATWIVPEAAGASRQGVPGSVTSVQPQEGRAC